MKEELKNIILNHKKNLIIVGDNLSEKTRKVIFPIIDDKINKNESIIVYDTKDEYLNNYYKTLKENNYNIVILNYKDLDKSEAWNPLLYPYKLYKEGNESKAVSYLNQIGDTFFYLEDEGSSLYMAARDFFTGACLALFEDAKEEEINILSVATILDGFREQLANTNYTSEYFNFKKNSKAAMLASTTYLASKEKRANIISFVSQKLMTLISRVKLVNLLSTTTINFDDLKTKPSAVFVLAPETNNIRSLSLLFVSQIVKMLIESGSNNKYNVVLEDVDSANYVEPLREFMNYQLFNNFRFYVTSVDLEKLFENYFYFDRLSLIIKVDEKKYTLLNYGSPIEYEKEEEQGILIDYPSVQISNPYVFDLKNFVLKKREDKINEMLASIKPSKPIVTNEEMNKMNETINKLEDNNSNNIKRYNENITNSLDKEMANKINSQENNSNKNHHSIDELIKKIDEKIAEIEKQENLYQENDENN